MQAAAHRSSGRAAPQRTRVIDALRRFAPEFYAQQCVEYGVRRKLDLVLRCRTPALGGHRYTCERCGSSTELYNSCRSRYCSQCQGPRRRDWLEATQKLVLPVPHFQVVFTLPRELRPLARAFPRIVYGLLFETAQYVLQTLATQRMDAKMAILAVLHTWDRELRLHPHVHCVVSAGGLRDDGTWVATHPTFLFPHRVMQKMYTGAFLARLREVLGPRLDKEQNALLHQLRRHLYRKRWVVWVGAPDGQDTDRLLKYLARYVYQNAISDHRLVNVGADAVTIRTRKAATAAIHGPEFVRRFALHFLPKRFRRVRHYGLWASSNRARLAAARAVVATKHVRQEEDQDEHEGEANECQADTEPQPRRRCARCGETLVVQSIPSDWWLDPCARGPP